MPSTPGEDCPPTGAMRWQLLHLLNLVQCIRILNLVYLYGRTPGTTVVLKVAKFKFSTSLESKPLSRELRPYRYLGTGLIPFERKLVLLVN
jgi:hypothetical protein